MQVKILFKSMHDIPTGRMRFGGKLGTVVVGKVTWVIDEPRNKVRSPTEGTRWKPPSEVYVLAAG